MQSHHEFSHCLNLGDARLLCNARRVSVLAVTGKVRWKDLPNVPTVQETADVSDFEVISWTGVAITAGVPKPIIDRIHAEVQRVIAMPELRGKPQGMGGETRGSTPPEMRALVSRQLALRVRVARERNLQAE